MQSSNNNIYLDGAAAMAVRGELLESFQQNILEYSANPEALHCEARKAASALDNAADQLISALTGDEYQLFWSSSATEAINMTFLFPFFRDRVILTSDSEHPAVQHAIEGAGFCEIRKVPVKRDGLLDFEILEKMLDSDVDVVSIHHVQNETGAIQDLCEVRRLINKKSPDAIFISDTVQSVAKLAVPWLEAEINIGFIGGHKVGAVSGGALICSFQNQPDTAKAFSLHLQNLRKISHSIGRADPAICINLADAVIFAESGNSLCKATYLSKTLRAKLADLAAETNVSITIPVPEDSASPYIVTFLMPPYQAEVVVRMLSDKGIMVSAGSACEASKSKPSQALISISGSDQNARTAIRVSFSFQSQISDIDRFIDALKEVLNEY
jgi:cysteine desulfurase